ncbi:TPA_asm: hypothetical protein G4P39_004834 [Salmonella enterica subsp. enterica serovar Muenchen]|nr:hypothetical protein [Salmonella enterica]HAE7669166.1 hypothetical protein [Salmonella enterica subsp. enterica serovar Muenchen]
MTTITREQQKQILIDTANHVISRDNTSPYSENLRELARIALASLEEKPVGEVSEKRYGLVMDGTVDLGGESTYRIIKGEKAMKRLPLGTKFYIAPPAPVVPDGYALVPVEPTDEMIAAAMNCEDVLFNSDESFCVQFGNIYEAMLAAAPQPEVK